jgi:hypothetical protein
MTSRIRSATSFTVEHHLDDGLPWEVSQTAAGSGPATLQLPLAYGRNPSASVAEGNRRASQYFSPYNGGSPVSGFDRDVAPVKLDWGLVHAGGQEYIRIFTGQMTNLKTAGQGAELVAQSATRLKLAKLIQPPAVSARLAGMNGSWPVSYALAQCGVYVSPAPRGGCRWWAPMHGSMWPMLPAVTPPYQGTDPALTALNAGGVFGVDNTNPRPTWVAGPYFLGLNCQLRTARQVRASILTIDLGSGTDLLSQAASAGRVEFWVRGDAADVNECAERLRQCHDVGRLRVREHRHEYRKGHVRGIADAGRLRDGIRRHEYPDAHALHHAPTDGAWHSVGAAWDISAGKLWVYLDGVEQTSTVVLTTANLPSAEGCQGRIPQG